VEIASRKGPYRSHAALNAPLAPSLRFVVWIGRLFAAPASLYVVASVWSLLTAPTCSAHSGGLGGEAFLLLAITSATLALGVLATRRAATSVRRRARVRSWLGKTAWTVLVALPTVLASVGVVATALFFDVQYLLLRCLDFGGSGGFH
jgi:hypothetical protein